MKKAIDSGVCPSFGRTPFILVYDTELHEYTFIDNSAASSQGGAGIKTAQNIVDLKADALLTPRCGENAAVVIKGADIKIYKTIDGTAKDNIKAFLDAKLSLLDEIHTGFHNHGGK